MKHRLSVLQFKDTASNFEKASDEDELMIAVSRLYLDNVDNIQFSWVKYGDNQELKMLNCGANDFMGTILSEEITSVPSVTTVSSARSGSTAT